MACVCVCAQLIVYTTENEFPLKLADGIFSCNVDENVPAVCQKGPNFKNRKFTSNTKKKQKTKTNTNKSMYCLQQPILAEVQVCCWKGETPLAKVTAIVQLCDASFAKMGRDEKGRIFNILAVYVYCYYVVASVKGFFLM